MIMETAQQQRRQRNMRGKHTENTLSTRLFDWAFFFLLLEWNEKRGARSKEWDGWGSETEKLKIERKIFRRGTDKKASNEKIDYEKEEGTIAGVAGKENSHWGVG